MQFQRNPGVPKFPRYQNYRPYLRTDFKRHCAYCTGHEDEYGGEDHFEIDHHQPVSLRPDLEVEYSNLYYCCRGCNKNGAKGTQWPSAELLAAGFRFFDPVAENAYGLHFDEDGQGQLQQLTNVGIYSIEKLRLNREALVRLRQRRRQMVALLNTELRQMEETITLLRAKGTEPSPELSERISQLQDTLKNLPVLSLLPLWWRS